MSNTIEPTEEQYEAVKTWCTMELGVRYGWRHIAQFLAEREHKLREQLAFMEAGSQSDYNAFAEALQKEDAYLAEINLINERLAELREVDGRKSRMLYDRDVVIDKLRAEREQAEHRIGELRVALNVVEMECERRGEKVLELRADLDAARARIAELEERSARRLDDSTAIDALVYAVACLELQPGSERDRAVRDAMARVINHVGAIEVRAKDSATKLVSTLVAGAKAREAAHLAHIKALREKLRVALAWGVREGVEELLADTAHYDVEGGEG